MSSAEELGAAVEEVDVIASSPVVGVRNLSLPECLRHPSYAPVIVRILEGAGDGLVVRIGGNEPQSGVGIGAFLIDVGGLDHCLEYLQWIKIPKLSAEVGISKYGDSMVADHSAGLTTIERPNGQLSSLAVHLHHRSAEIRYYLRVEQGKEGVLRTEGVPER